MATIKIEQERRPAIFTIKNVHVAKYLGMEVNMEYNVHVLGLFQIRNEDETDAYFVVELEDGRCIYTVPTNIRFTDTGRGDENVTFVN